MDEGESCGVINVARVFNEIPTVSSPYDLHITLKQVMLPEETIYLSARNIGGKNIRR